MEWLTLIAAVFGGGAAIFGISLVTHRFGMAGLICVIAALLALGALFS